MFRKLLLILLIFALSACAMLNLARPVSEEAIANTKRVGVVSNLGYMFNGESIGTTVFNNEYFSAAVPEWQLDKFAVDTILNLLHSNPHFASAALKRGSLTLIQMQPDGGQAFWQAAEAQHFDKLVVVRPKLTRDDSQLRPAYGLFERSLLGSGIRCLYTSYIVEVYDVTSRKPIAWEWGGDEPCQFGKDDDIPFKRSFDEYTSWEQLDMKKRLQARISESLSYALNKLDLISSN